MDEVIVKEDEGVSPEESSAHEVAVAEGATQVHAEHAESQADEAKAAAEVAVAAAQVQAETAAVAAEAAERAEAAETGAVVTGQAILSALEAQQQSLNAFMEEMRESRKPKETAPVAEPDKKPDKKPERKVPWYYR